MTIVIPKWLDLKIKASKCNEKTFAIFVVKRELVNLSSFRLHGFKVDLHLKAELEDFFSLKKNKIQLQTLLRVLT